MVKFDTYYQNIDMFYHCKHASPSKRKFQHSGPWTLLVNLAICWNLRMTIYFMIFWIVYFKYIWRTVLYFSSKISRCPYKLIKMRISGSVNYWNAQVSAFFIFYDKFSLEAQDTYSHHIIVYHDSIALFRSVGKLVDHLLFPFDNWQVYNTISIWI